MQWVGVHLRKDLDQPQWDKVHRQMALSNAKLHRIATYALERGRHTDTTLALIAKAAGVKEIKTPPELTRAEERVRDITEDIE